MRLLEGIVDAQGEIGRLRRDLHAHPELQYEERRTADIVAGRLEAWGIPVHRGLGGTGVVGLVRGELGPGRMIGLRADMDALPISEANTFAHRSVHAGRMHACGHDGHVAMLLAAARHLAAHRDFAGSVALVFQPAEEGGGGAQRMIDDGFFGLFPCDVMFAIHNWPGVPEGTLAVCDGAALAATNEFSIRVTGKGAHAAMPHLGVDPVLAAAQIVLALQSVVSRSLRPIDAAVVSTTLFHAGDTENVIPDVATLGGTVRTFSDAVTDRIEERIREIATGTAAALGARAEVEFRRNYPPTLNHIEWARLAADVGEAVLGPANVVRGADPTLGGEDFSYFLRQRPGAYLFLGNGGGDHRGTGHGPGPCTLHNASYDFNDGLIPIGGSYWVALARRYLGAA
jgi:hippurate hydrolase